MGFTIFFGGGEEGGEVRLAECPPACRGRVEGSSVVGWAVSGWLGELEKGVNGWSFNSDGEATQGRADSFSDSLLQLEAT